MAVVNYVEILGGTGVSGKFGETFHFTRKFKIRCDTLTTTKTAIVDYVGIVYGESHPEFSPCIAMEFDLSPGDESGLWWDLTWKYYNPPPEHSPDPTTQIPKDSWSATGSTATGPCWKDKDGVVITNSAGDPLEDLEREIAEFGWSLTKNYLGTSWQSVARNYSNAVNDAFWSGAGVRCYKCAFKGAQLKRFTLPSGTDLDYWETSWEFTYRPATLNAETNTWIPGWDLTPWDIGFAQKVANDGTPSGSGTKRAAIQGQDHKPVKNPVALQGGIAKAAGQPPSALQFRVYQEMDFDAAFGSPPS